MPVPRSTYSATSATVRLAVMVTAVLVATVARSWTPLKPLVLGPAMNDDTVIAPPADSYYAVYFQRNDLAFIWAGCNTGVVRYQWRDGAFTRFRLVGATTSNCGGEWQSAVFLHGLANVTAGTLEGDDLYLQLAADSGTMHFTRVQQ